MNLHTQQLQQIPKFYWHLSKLALQVQKEKSSQILSQSMKRSGLPTGLAQAIERDSTLETDPSYLGHNLKVSLEETLKLSLSFLISRVLILKHLAHKIQFTSVTQSCLLFATPWTAARQDSPSIANSWSLLISIESVMPSNQLILCRPLLLPSSFPSSRVFSNESALHIAWPKNQSFRFSIIPSNE